MHDQRVEARAFLGGEDFRHGVGVARIGAEPIDRLGGKRHDLAAGKRLRGFGNGLFCGGTDGHGRPPFRVLPQTGQATVLKSVNRIPPRA